MKKLKELINQREYAQAKARILDHRDQIEEIVDTLLECIDELEKRIPEWRKEGDFKKEIEKYFPSSATGKDLDKIGAIQATPGGYNADNVEMILTDNKGKKHTITPTDEEEFTINHDGHWTGQYHWATNLSNEEDERVINIISRGVIHSIEAKVSLSNDDELEEETTNPDSTPPKIDFHIDKD